MNLLFFPSLVCRPAFLRRRDVMILASLAATTDQNYKAVAIPPEVDAEAWAEVDLVLENSGPNALDPRKISLLHSHKRDAHTGGCCGIESVKPLSESFVPFFVNIAAELNHLANTMVTIMLLLGNHNRQTPPDFPPNVSTYPNSLF